MLIFAPVKIKITPFGRLCSERHNSGFLREGMQEKFHPTLALEPTRHTVAEFLFCETRASMVDYTRGMLFVREQYN